MKKLTIILTIALTGFIAQAKITDKQSQAFSNGDFAGNGGDVLNCPNETTLLDFYEGTLGDNPIKIDLGPESLSLEEKVDFYINKLKRVSPVRAKRYKAEADTFISDTFFVSGAELTDIPDSHHLLKPKGCDFLQIAIRPPKAARLNGKQYIVSQDLWDLLSKDHKVGLIFHEIIYKEAVVFGHKNSIETRKLNRLIASKAFASVTKKELDDLLISINMPPLGQNPFFTDLFFDNATRNAKGEVTSGVLA